MELTWDSRVDTLGNGGHDEEHSLSHLPGGVALPQSGVKLKRDREREGLMSNLHSLNHLFKSVGLVLVPQHLMMQCLINIQLTL